MPAVLIIRDNETGATIERSAPLAEQMISRDPGRFEIVEAMQSSPFAATAWRHWKPTASIWSAAAPGLTPLDAA